MPTHLPIPLAYYLAASRTSRPPASAPAARCAPRRAARREHGDGERVPQTKRTPSFVEWWLEYPAEFIVAGSAPPPPTDDRVRELLATTARIAANAWASSATPSTTRSPVSRLLVADASAPPSPASRRPSPISRRPRDRGPPSPISRRSRHCCPSLEPALNRLTHLPTHFTTLNPPSLHPSFSLSPRFLCPLSVNLPLLSLPHPLSPFHFWSQFPDPSTQWSGERGRETGTPPDARSAFADCVRQGQQSPGLRPAQGAYSGAEQGAYEGADPTRHLIRHPSQGAECLPSALLAKRAGQPWRRHR